MLGLQAGSLLRGWLGLAPSPEVHVGCSLGGAIASAHMVLVCSRPFPVPLTRGACHPRSAGLAIGLGLSAHT